MAVESKHWTIRDEEENFIHEELLGRGGYGEVHKLLDMTLSKTFARKIVRPWAGIRQEHIDNEVHAINKLCKSKHMNIVQVLDSGRLKADGVFYFIDMELCEISLEKYMQGETINNLINWNTVRIRNDVHEHAYKIMQQILNGLIFIHCLDEVHRDLSPNNVLFMNGYWKIADFGLTSEATSNRLCSTSAARGKSCYRAPEMLRETSPGFNKKMDIWSFGCISFELFTGRKAFPSDYEVISYSISKKKPKTYFKHIDSTTKFYISDLFELEPESRPAARELLKLKFTSEMPLTNPTLSTGNRTQKKRRLEQQVSPQSELLKATLEWADSNGKSELILTLLGCGICPIHNMVTDGMSLLMQAISFGYLEVVEWFRRSGFKDIYPGLHQAFLEGVAPSAAEERQWEAAKFLVRYGADVSAKGFEGKTVLHSAAEEGRPDVVALLLDKIDRADVAAKDQSQRTALHHAAMKGHPDVVALLLDKMDRADVAAKDYCQSTALHWAARNGHKDVVVLLLDKMDRADVAAKDNDQKTALHLAAVNGNVDMVTLLLDRIDGADVAAKDEDGWTAWHRAAFKGHADVVALLLEKMEEADIVVKGDLGWTALHRAAGNGHADMVALLLERNPDLIAAKDDLGWTALHRAAINGHPDVVALLLGRNPDLVAVKDRWQMTALHYAAVYGHRDVVALLLERNPDLIAAKDDEGSTALHCAAQEGHTDVVALLLDKHPDLIAAKDDWGRTALHRAAGNGHKDVVELLEMCERGQRIN